tara:strand:- start:527 stop:1435 length:909 start_codon:yes stop_codon:yes gene_type:complete
MAQYHLNSDERSLAIYCRSEDGVSLGDGTYRFNFDSVIGNPSEQNKRMVVGVKSMNFINCEYNVNKYTNVVNWKGINYTIPETLYGNYNVSQIIQLVTGATITGTIDTTTITNPAAWLGSNPPNIALTYDDVKNKFVVDATVGNTQLFPNNFWKMLGFTEYYNIATPVFANIPANLDTFNSLIVKTNLGVSAFTSKSKNVENVLARIPVNTKMFGETVTYLADNPFLSLINDKSFHVLELTFFNEYATNSLEPRPITFNGTNFSITLIVHFIYEPLLIRNLNSIHQSILPEKEEAEEEVLKK